MHEPRLADYAMLLFLGLVWGASFLFIGVAVKGVPPLTLTAVRCVIASLALLLVARAMGYAVPREVRAWLIFLALGLTNSGIPFVLIALGQTRIDSSLAAILIATVPLFTLVLAHWFTDDKSTPRRIAGALIGFGGIVLLMGPPALLGLGADIAAQLMIVGGALCFSITQILVKRYGGALLIGAACSIACSALWTIPLALILERPWQIEPTLTEAGAIVILALASTAAAHFVFFVLIGRTGPQFVTLNNYIAPTVGMALGIAVLGEAPRWSAYVALAVILLGIAIATWRPRAALVPAVGR